MGAVFLRLGITAFGGPAAHFAIMDKAHRTQTEILGKANLKELDTADEPLAKGARKCSADHLGFLRGRK